MIPQCLDGPSRATRFKLPVTRGIDLSRLSHAEKDELILSLLPLIEQLEAALARIAELEKRLAVFERPAKTPDNSSLPPSTGPNPDRPAGDKPPRKSRPGVGRALELNPDHVVAMQGLMPARIAPPPMRSYTYRGVCCSAGKANFRRSGSARWPRLDLGHLTADAPCYLLPTPGWRSRLLPDR